MLKPKFQVPINPENQQNEKELEKSKLKNEQAQKVMKVIFDNDANNRDGGGNQFDGASNTDEYANNTDIEAASTVTKDANRFGYGIQDGRPAYYSRKPTTVHSNVSRMTGQTQMTKINQVQVQPGIGMTAPPDQPTAVPAKDERRNTLLLGNKQPLVKQPPAAVQIADEEASSQGVMPAQVRRFQSNPRAAQMQKTRNPQTLNEGGVMRASGGQPHQTIGYRTGRGGPVQGAIRRDDLRTIEPGGADDDRTQMTSETHFRGLLQPRASSKRVSERDANPETVLPDINDKNKMPGKKEVPKDYGQQQSENNVQLYGLTTPLTGAKPRQSRLSRQSRGSIQTESAGRMGRGPVGAFNYSKVKYYPKNPIKDKGTMSEHNYNGQPYGRQNPQVQTMEGSQAAQQATHTELNEQEKNHKASMETGDFPKDTVQDSQQERMVNQRSLNQQTAGSVDNRIDVSSDPPNFKQKQVLLHEQKEIQRKQLELQRQQIILQQQQLQLQLDRLEANQRKGGKGELDREQQQQLQRVITEVGVGTTPKAVSAKMTSAHIESPAKISLAASAQDPSLEGALQSKVSSHTKELAVGDATPHIGEEQQVSSASGVRTAVVGGQPAEGAAEFNNVQVEQASTNALASNTPLDRGHSQADGQRPEGTGDESNAAYQRDTAIGVLDANYKHVVTHDGVPAESVRRRPNDLVGNVISVEANMGKQLPSPRKAHKMGMRTGPEVFQTDGNYNPMHSYGSKKYTFGGKQMTQLQAEQMHHFMARQRGDSQSTETDQEYIVNNGKQHQQYWKNGKKHSVIYGPSGAVAHYVDHFPPPNQHKGKVLYDNSEPGLNHRQESPSKNIQKERDDKYNQPFDGQLPNNTFQKLFNQPHHKKPSNFTIQSTGEYFNEKHSMYINQQTENEADYEDQSQEILAGKSKSRSKAGSKMSDQTAVSGVAIFEAGKASNQQMNFTGFDFKRKSIINANDSAKIQEDPNNEINSSDALDAHPDDKVKAYSGPKQPTQQSHRSRHGRAQSTVRNQNTTGSLMDGTLPDIEPGGVSPPKGRNRNNTIQPQPNPEQTGDEQNDEKDDNFTTLPEIPGTDKAPGRKIPSLKFAKQQKNPQLQQTGLTPITFVSKDQQMKADYHIDSEVDEVQMPNQNDKAKKDAGSPPNYVNMHQSPSFGGAYPPPHMYGHPGHHLPPMPTYPLPYAPPPPVHPSYAIGPDGQLQVATPAQIAAFYQNLQNSQVFMNRSTGSPQDGSAGPFHATGASQLSNLDINVSQDSKTKMYVYARKSQDGSNANAVHEQAEEHKDAEGRMSSGKPSPQENSPRAYSPSKRAAHDFEDPDQDADDIEGGFNSEYSQISRTLDSEMRQFVGEFEKLQSHNDRRSELMVRRIRLKHPIFHLLTINAFKYLFENANLFRLKPNQCVYKEYQPAKAHVYFVLYGQMEFRNSKVGRFGEIIGLGWTVGEEILYGEDDQSDILRLENCVSTQHSCLLQVSVDDLVCMSTQKHVTAGGGNLEQDYRILLSFLEKNFEVKSSWRKAKGLLERIKEARAEEENQSR